jgi:hypothetical protein
MIISKPAIIFHTSQAFFNFLSMACFASVASFQAKWGVGPSGLTGFALFVSISGILLSLFLIPPGVTRRVCSHGHGLRFQPSYRLHNHHLGMDGSRVQKRQQ